jgi:hypothetical protein
LVVHFTTLGGARRSLEQAGFALQRAWASEDARALDLTAERCTADSIQLLATRLPPGA